MTDLPTTDQPALNVGQTVTQILNDAIPIAETAIVEAVPFLGIPGLKQLWELLFQYLIGQLTGALGTQAAFIVMDFQTYENVQAVLKTTAALRVAQSVGSTDDVTTARQASDAAAVNLLSYIGDAHP